MDEKPTRRQKLFDIARRTLKASSEISFARSKHNLSDEGDERGQEELEIFHEDLCLLSALTSAAAAGGAGGVDSYFASVCLYSRSHIFSFGARIIDRINDCKEKDE